MFLYQDFWKKPVRVATRAPIHRSLQALRDWNPQKVSERRPFTESSFRPPSPWCVLPSTRTISLLNSLRDSQNFLRNSFSRVSKNGFQRAILKRRCFSVRFAPPPLVFPPPPSSVQLSGGRQKASTYASLRVVNLEASQDDMEGALEQHPPDHKTIQKSKVVALQREFLHITLWECRSLQEI